MGRAERALRERFGHGPLKLVDAKPLPVGGYSKDRDARSGYATGTLARGYKLHVLRDARCPAVPDHWVVASMNHKEVAVAPDLLDQRAAALAMALAGAAVAWVSLFGYLAGDNGYDSNRLYDLAMEVNLQLVAPPRRSAKGLGKIRHSPHRLRGLELARAPHPLNPLGRAGVAKSFGRGLLRERDAIERSFGTWGNWGGGLGPLPNWVRRPRRVALWVAGKLLCDGVRQALKEGLLPHGRPNEKQRLAA
jgi:hypothetical protein